VRLLEEQGERMHLVCITTKPLASRREACHGRRHGEPRNLDVVLALCTAATYKDAMHELWAVARQGTGVRPLQHAPKSTPGCAYATVRAHRQRTRGAHAGVGTTLAVPLAPPPGLRACTSKVAAVIPGHEGSRRCTPDGLCDVGSWESTQGDLGWLQQHGAWICRCLIEIVSCERAGGTPMYMHMFCHT
jgi:hypothetical protein